MIKTSAMNTGLQWCSNSAAWLSSGSNSFLRAASNVGIGTTTPACALDVAGTGSFASNVRVGSNLVLAGDIVPTGNHTQNIGSSNNRFGTAWIDTLHIASNTLYLGATPVLGTSGQTVKITADVDQSINITTTGVGATQLTSAGEVDISTSGINGNVKINANGAGGQVARGSTSAVVLTAPTTLVGGAMTGSSNMTVNGDLTVNGTTGSLNVTTLQVKDNIVLLNMGQTGNGVSLRRRRCVLNVGWNR